jgi:hypothetical protein
MRIDEVVIGTEYSATAYGRRVRVVKQAIIQPNRYSSRQVRGFECEILDELTGEVLRTSNMQAKHLFQPWADYIAERDRSEAIRAKGEAMEAAVTDALTRLGIFGYVDVSAHTYRNPMQVVVRLSEPQVVELVRLVENGVIYIMPKVDA